jgi:RNA polymerase sigma-70 factor, ECF subfamily
VKGEKALDHDVKLAKEGDKAAFVRLIDQNRASMFRIANSILKSEDDIGDAMQEAILKAFKGLPNLKDNKYFKTWLIKILIHESSALLRKRKKLIPLSEVIDQGYLDRYENTEVLNAIYTLEEDFRVVTILYYYEDMSIQAISSILNIPEGTVKSRLSRARIKLYGLLIQEGSDTCER